MRMSDVWQGFRFAHTKGAEDNATELVGTGGPFPRVTLKAVTTSKVHCVAQQVAEGCRNRQPRWQGQDSKGLSQAGGAERRQLWWGWDQEHPVKLLLCSGGRWVLQSMC